MPEKKEDYNPYVKVLGDLKLLMKKKMLDDKIHYKQHENMDDDYEEDKEEKEEKTEEKGKKKEVAKQESEMDEDYVRDYMKGKRDKKSEPGASLMVAVSKKSGKGKYGKSKGKKRA